MTSGLTEKCQDCGCPLDGPSGTYCIRCGATRCAKVRERVGSTAWKPGQPGRVPFHGRPAVAIDLLRQAESAFKEIQCPLSKSQKKILRKLLQSLLKKEATLV